MNMKYRISTDRKTLTIICDPDELAEPQDLHSDKAMHDFLEPLTCNSELEWVRPEDAGDLTGAPMLGILAEERPYFHEDATVSHRITGPNLIREIQERWAFMDYQVSSVLERLKQNGYVNFTC